MNVSISIVVLLILSSSYALTVAQAGLIEPLIDAYYDVQESYWFTSLTKTTTLKRPIIISADAYAGGSTSDIVLWKSSPQSSSSSSNIKIVAAVVDPQVISWDKEEERNTVYMLIVKYDDDEDYYLCPSSSSSSFQPYSIIDDILPSWLITSEKQKQLFGGRIIAMGDWTMINDDLRTMMNENWKIESIPPPPPPFYNDCSVGTSFSSSSSSSSLLSVNNDGQWLHHEMPRYSLIFGWISSSSSSSSTTTTNNII